MDGLNGLELEFDYEVWATDMKRMFGSIKEKEKSLLTYAILCGKTINSSRDDDYEM